jgi:hypothetical protein
MFLYPLLPPEYSHDNIAQKDRNTILINIKTVNYNALQNLSVTPPNDYADADKGYQA